MSVLFGHPTGNPNSHHAALAHFEADRLEAFCVPWMPSQTVLRMLERIKPLSPMTRRLSRRYFEPLTRAPKVQGVIGECSRLIKRAVGLGDERLSYEANDWLMRTMAHEVGRPKVTAVHSYEDCSLSQFREAKRLGKACIYDMPIGYYPAWENTQAELARRYADWLPAGGLPSSRYVRPDQKHAEMELADLVLVPGSFVERTIREFHPQKRVVRAPYGVDCVYWSPPDRKLSQGRLRFIYAGQLSLRKGIPLLLEAWKRAALPDAELELVGIWQLAEGRRIGLPEGVSVFPQCSREALRDRYRAADVFVFPSFFEGMSLALLEAMACGLPTIASDGVAGGEIVGLGCGRLVETGNIDALVEALQQFPRGGELSAMSGRARVHATGFSWESYRRCVSRAVDSFV